MFNKEMIDNLNISVDESELYDKCENFINGEEPTKDQINLIRNYFIDCIKGDKSCLLLHISDYIYDLLVFITEYSRPDIYHKEHFHKLLNDRIGFINEIDLIKESKVLSKYVIDHDDIANTINEICKSVIVDKESTIECISILNEEYYSTNIDELISYDFLIKYFDSISSYNKLYSKFAEAIKEGKSYEI